MIAVCVEAPAQPDHCFGICTELSLGEPDRYHPSIGKGVARRKAECFVDMSFSFRASPEKMLGDTD